MEKGGIVQFLTIGTGGILLLVIGLITFYVIYQRRILRQQQSIAQRELEHQKELLSAAVTSQEQERKRIAEDLHDNLGSRLHALNLYLQRVKSKSNDALLEEGIKILEETIADVRELSHTLLPATLTELGFQEAALTFCNRLSSGASTIFEFNSNNSERITAIRELALYRVMQELCTNTLKHASAARAKINFSINNDDFKLDYSDDGRGINFSQFVQPKGLGLRNIESRCSMIEAKLEYGTDTASGFRIVVTGKVK